MSEKMTSSLHMKLYVLLPPEVSVEETYMYNVVTQSQTRRPHTIDMFRLS
jgi:hypothetical protein